MFFPFVLVQTAAANPVDQDGDGYAFNAQSPATKDCDDSDPDVSPREQEIIGDRVDQDCDGHDALRRTLLMDNFQGPSWMLQSANATNDLLEVNAGGSAELPLSIFNPQGRLHLAVEVESKSSTNCSVLLTATPSGGTPITQVQAITSIGTNVLSFLSLPDPTLTVNRIRFDCPAAAYIFVDWIALQNAPDVVFPPGKEISAFWRDINAPGVTLFSGAMRTANLLVPNTTVLLSGSDNAGVGMKNVDAGTPWQTINGTGAEGVQQLAVWDVAGVEFDQDETLFEVFALSGELVGTKEVVGGLWYSPDEGGSWELLADTLDDGIGMAGRRGECGTNKDVAAGQFLVPDMNVVSEYCGATPDSCFNQWNPFLWIASNYFHTYYDFDGSSVASRDFAVHAYNEYEGLCEETVEDLPSDQFIGAMARSSGPAPYLVVGYRASSYEYPEERLPSLYVCILPSSPYDLADPGLECSDLPDLVCLPVDGSEGMDVSDLEVDPADPSVVYVADGGDDPLVVDGELVEDCEGANGGSVSMLYVTGTGFHLTDISSLSWLGDDYGVTGVSMDPEGDYLLAFLPGDDYNGLGAPIWRFHRDDILTGVWEQPLYAPTGDGCGGATGACGERRLLGRLVSK